MHVSVRMLLEYWCTAVSFDCQHLLWTMPPARHSSLFVLQLKPKSGMLSQPSGCRAYVFLRTHTPHHNPAEAERGAVSSPARAWVIPPRVETSAKRKKAKKKKNCVSNAKKTPREPFVGFRLPFQTSIPAHTRQDQTRTAHCATVPSAVQFKRLCNTCCRLASQHSA